MHRRKSRPSPSHGKKKLVDESTAKANAAFLFDDKSEHSNVDVPIPKGVPTSQGSTQVSPLSSPCSFSSLKPFNGREAPRAGLVSSLSPPHPSTQILVGGRDDDEKRDRLPSVASLLCTTRHSSNGNHPRRDADLCSSSLTRISSSKNTASHATDIIPRPTTPSFHENVSLKTGAAREEGSRNCSTVHPALPLDPSFPSPSIDIGSTSDFAQTLPPPDWNSTPNGFSHSLLIWGKRRQAKVVRVIVRLQPPLTFTPNAYLHYKVQPALKERDLGALPALACTASPITAEGISHLFTGPSYIATSTSPPVEGRSPPPLTSTVDANLSPPFSFSGKDHENGHQDVSVVAKDGNASFVGGKKMERARKDRKRLDSFLPLFDKSFPFQKSSSLSTYSSGSCSSTPAVEGPSVFNQSSSHIAPSASTHLTPLATPHPPSGISLGSPYLASSIQGSGEYASPFSAHAGVGGASSASSDGSDARIPLSTCVAASPDVDIASIAKGGSTPSRLSSRYPSTILTLIPPTTINALPSPSSGPVKSFSLSSFASGGAGHLSSSTESFQRCASPFSGGFSFAVHGVLKPPNHNSNSSSTSSTSTNPVGRGGGRKGEEEENLREMLVHPLVSRAQNGRSSTVVLCGPSGTGKTHTLRQLSLLFSQELLSAVHQSEGDVLEMSYVQLLGEHAYHLIGPASHIDQCGIPLPSPSPPPFDANSRKERKKEGEAVMENMESKGLPLSSDINTSSFFAAKFDEEEACFLPRVIIRSPQDILSNLDQAEELKCVRSQELNARSSCSHCIFALRWTRCWKGIPVLSSAITIVDVAAHPVEPSVPSYSDPNSYSSYNKESDRSSCSPTNNALSKNSAASATATLRSLIETLGCREEYETGVHRSPSPSIPSTSSSQSASLPLLAHYLRLIWKSSDRHNDCFRQTEQRKIVESVGGIGEHGMSKNRIVNGKKWVEQLQKGDGSVEGESEDEEEEEMLTVFLLSVSLAASHYEDTVQFLNLGEKLCTLQRRVVRSEENAVPTSSSSSLHHEKKTVESALYQRNNAPSPITLTLPVIAPDSQNDELLYQNLVVKGGNDVNHSPPLIPGIHVVENAHERQEKKEEGGTIPLHQSSPDSRNFCSTHDCNVNSSVNLTRLVNPNQNTKTSLLYPTFLGGSVSEEGKDKERSTSCSKRANNNGTSTILCSSKSQVYHYNDHHQDRHPPASPISPFAAPQRVPTGGGNDDGRRDEMARAESSIIAGETAVRVERGKSGRNAKFTVVNSPAYSIPVRPCKRLDFNRDGASPRARTTTAAAAQSLKDLEEMEWTHAMLEQEIQMARKMRSVEEALRGTEPPFLPPSVGTFPSHGKYLLSMDNGKEKGKNGKSTHKGENEEENEGGGDILEGIDAEENNETVEVSKETSSKKKRKKDKVIQKRRNSKLRETSMTHSERIIALQKEEALLLSAKDFVQNNILLAKQKIQSTEEMEPQASGKGSEKLLPKSASFCALENFSLPYIPSDYHSASPAVGKGKQIESGVETVPETDVIGESNGIESETGMGEVLLPPSLSFLIEEQCYPYSDHSVLPSDGVCFSSFCAPRPCFAPSQGITGVKENAQETAQITPQEQSAPPSSTPSSLTTMSNTNSTGAIPALPVSIHDPLQPSPCDGGTPPQHVIPQYDSTNNKSSFSLHPFRPYSSTSFSPFPGVVPAQIEGENRANSGISSRLVPSLVLDERTIVHSLLKELQMMQAGHEHRGPHNDGIEVPNTEERRSTEDASGAASPQALPWGIIARYICRCEALLLSREEHIQVLKYRLKASCRERERQSNRWLREKERQVELQKRLCDFCVWIETVYDENTELLCGMEELQMALYREKAAKTISYEISNRADSTQQVDSREVEELNKVIEAQRKHLTVLQDGLMKVGVERDDALHQKNSMAKKLEEVESVLNGMLKGLTPQETNRIMDCQSLMECSFPSSYPSPNISHPSLLPVPVPTSSSSILMSKSTTSITSLQAMGSAGSNSGSVKDPSARDVVCSSTEILAKKCPSPFLAPSPAERGVESDGGKNGKEEVTMEESKASSSPSKSNKPSSPSPMAFTSTIITGVNTVNTSANLHNILPFPSLRESVASSSSPPHSPSHQSESNYLTHHPHKINNSTSSSPLLNDSLPSSLSITSCAPSCGLPSSTSLPITTAGLHALWEEGVEGRELKEEPPSFPLAPKVNGMSGNVTSVVEGGSIVDTAKVQEGKKKESSSLINTITSPSPPSPPVIASVEHHEILVLRSELRTVKRQLAINRDITKEREAVVEEWERKVEEVFENLQKTEKKYLKAQSENAKLLKYQSLLEDHIVKEKVNCYEQAKMLCRLEEEKMELLHTIREMEFQQSQGNTEMSRLSDLVSNLRQMLGTGHRKLNAMRNTMKEFEIQRARRESILTKFYADKIRELEEELLNAGDKVNKTAKRQGMVSINFRSTRNYRINSNIMNNSTSKTKYQGGVTSFSSIGSGGEGSRSQLFAPQKSQSMRKISDSSLLRGRSSEVLKIDSKK